MFNGNTSPVLFNEIPDDTGSPAVSAPDAVVAFPDDVFPDGISAEGYFHTVRWCIGEVILIENIPIASAFTAVHGGLSCP